MSWPDQWVLRVWARRAAPGRCRRCRTPGAKRGRARCRAAGAALDLYTGRGRDRPCGRPPAQLLACGTTALGFYLGCVAAKRACGNGCTVRVWGIHRAAMRFILAQLIRVRWLRHRSALRQCRITWVRKAFTASLLPGTA